MEHKITHFNIQLSSSGFKANFQQRAKHLKRCLPPLLRGVFVITVGPCYFKLLALGIQQKWESSLIIMVAT